MPLSWKNIKQRSKGKGLKAIVGIRTFAPSLAMLNKTSSAAAFVQPADGSQIIEEPASAVQQVEDLNHEKVLTTIGCDVSKSKAVQNRCETCSTDMVLL